MRRWISAWHGRISGSWTAAAVLAVALLAFTGIAATKASSPDVDPVNPGGIRTLVVEAHDEWTGDPARVPPAPRVTHAEATLAVRNRNPLNIKYGSLTQKYVAQGLASISRVLPTDGGRFLKFQSAAAGFRAAVELLTSPLYTSLDLNSALKRWSNNGYGAEIVARTPIDPKTTITDLEQERLTQLLVAMASAEGYRSSAMSDEIAHAVANAAIPNGKAATPQQ